MCDFSAQGDDSSKGVVAIWCHACVRQKSFLCPGQVLISWALVYLSA